MNAFMVYVYDVRDVLLVVINYAIDTTLKP
jgi:hypothetical protein